MLNTVRKIKDNFVGPAIDEELGRDKEILGSPTKEWKSVYTQQGDCLLVKASKESGKYFENNFDSIPADAEELDQNMILKGNTNSHALYGGDFTILRNGAGQIFVRVTKPCVLAHVKDLTSLKRAEHNGQWIPTGDYYFRGLVEMDHISKLKRQVID